MRLSGIQNTAKLPIESNLCRLFWHRSPSKLHNFSYSFPLLYNETFWHIKLCKISTKAALDLISLPLDDLENYTKVPLSYCDISLQFVLEGATNEATLLVYSKVGD